MSQAHKLLYDEISRLPLEKVGKALSFVRYLKQEPEAPLEIDAQEEAELLVMLDSGEAVSSSDVLASIEALPND